MNEAQLPARVLMIHNDAQSFYALRRDLVVHLKKNVSELMVAVPTESVQSQKDLAWLRTLQIPVLTYSLDRTGKNPWRDLKTFFELKKLFEAHRPQLIFLTTIKPVIYGSLAAQWASTSPKTISMITGLGSVFAESKKLKHRILRSCVSLLYRIALRTNSFVFFQNPDDRELFQAEGILKQGLETDVLPGSGVHLEEFPFSPPPKGPLRFLFAGRLIEEKGVRYFVEAAKVLKQKYPELNFSVAGSIDKNPGSIRQSELDEWIRAGWINYLGYSSDVASLIERHSMVVLPSYYREGTPKILLEALAVGRPLITCDLPGCREVLQNEVNGLFVQERSLGDLVAKMESLVQGKYSLQEMGKASRKLAEEKFDQKIVNSKVLQTLASVL